MRHSRIQPRSRVVRRPDARCAGAARRHRRARRGRGRLRPSRGDRRHAGHEAPRRRECAARRAGGSSRHERDAHPRPRLHEGPSRHRGEQPPDPPRRRRRRPQRDHLQRRRAPRPVRDRARRAADDRRLRGDLRAHGTSRARSARAVRAARRDGGGMARRPRRLDALPRARTHASALAGHDGREASTSRRPGGRSRSSRRRCVRGSTFARCARAACCTSGPAASCDERRFRCRPPLSRGGVPAARARAARGRLVPRATRRARRQSAPRSDPSGSTSTPSARRRSRTRNWNAVHAPRGTSSIR